MADDLEGKSIEELEAILKDPSLLDASPPAEPAPEPVVEEPAPTEPTEPTPTETAPAAEPVEPAPTEESFEEQIRKSLVEEAEARAKHFESVAGKHAGELGFVRQQIQRLQEQLLSRSSADPDEIREDRGAPPPPHQPTPQTGDQIALWAVNQAIQNSARDFMAGHADQEQLRPDMVKYLSETKYDASHLFETRDPVRAAQETVRALEEAYWHAKSQHHARVRSDLEVRRADQVRNLQKAKMRGGPTQSGATPAPRPVAKNLDDMSISELEGELKRLTR